MHVPELAYTFDPTADFRSICPDIFRRALLMLTKEFSTPDVANLRNDLGISDEELLKGVTELAQSLEKIFVENYHIINEEQSPEERARTTAYMLRDAGYFRVNRKIRALFTSAVGAITVATYQKTHEEADAVSAGKLPANLKQLRDEIRELVDRSIEELQNMETGTK